MRIEKGLLLVLLKPCLLLRSSGRIIFVSRTSRPFVLGKAALASGVVAHAVNVSWPSLGGEPGYGGFEYDF